MKYVRNLPKEDPREYENLKKQGWTLLKEPNVYVSLLLSLPFGFLGAYLGICAFPKLHIYVRDMLSMLMSDKEIILPVNLQYIIALYIYVIVHELIHLICMPNFIKSQNTYLSIHIWGGVTSTEEIMSKGRFITISLMPYLLLTFVVPALLLYTNLPISLIALLVLINATGSCMDILGVALICIQVPDGAKIRNVGINTFYKI